MNQGKILIVEDQPELAEVLDYQLQAQGFSTLVAMDGLNACRMAGSEQPDLILLDVLLPDLDGWEVCRLIRARRDMEIGTVPIVMLTARGAASDRMHGLELGADAYLTKPYSIREVTLTARRLIERRRREQELSGRVARLEARADHQGTVQDILCHELRNQLLVLRGFSNLLGRSGTDHQENRAQTCLQAVERSSQALGNLAESLLLLSRREHQDLLLPADSPDLPALAGQLIELYRPLALQREMDLVLDAGAAPAKPELNSIGLRLVISNLLENALKYAPRGTAVTLRLAAPPGARLELAVEDEGPGVPEADRERIFQRFVRGRLPDSASPGSGLGLYIARVVTEAMQGRIGVAPLRSGGSRFLASFPMGH